MSIRAFVSLIKNALGLSAAQVSAQKTDPWLTAAQSGDNPLSLRTAHHYGEPAENTEPEGGDSEPEGDDADYERFVSEVWEQPGIVCQNIELERCYWNGMAFPCQLHSLVPRRDASYYMNVIENGRRRIFVSHNWKWRRDGKQLDDSCFVALKLGIDPDHALRWVAVPTSPAVALSAEHDHVTTSDRRFLIEYINAQGEKSFRVVSRCIRLGDHFTARCHFRWGQRRHFKFANLQSVFDLATGEQIPKDIFADATALSAFTRARALKS